MRFVMDGVEFELTAEQVCSRLKSHVPQDIHEHWVVIDGQRWPVKQALAIATGTDKSRFVSRTARRHLRNLGFMTSDDGKSRKVGLITLGGPVRFEYASAARYCYCFGVVHLAIRRSSHP